MKYLEKLIKGMRKIWYRFKHYIRWHVLSIEYKPSPDWIFDNTFKYLDPYKRGVKVYWNKRWEEEKPDIDIFLTNINNINSYFINSILHKDEWTLLLNSINYDDGTFELLFQKRNDVKSFHFHYYDISYLTRGFNHVVGISFGETIWLQKKVLKQIEERKNEEQNGH